MFYHGLFIVKNGYLYKDRAPTMVTRITPDSIIHELEWAMILDIHGSRGFLLYPDMIRVIHLIELLDELPIEQHMSVELLERLERIADEYIKTLV